MSVLGPHIAEPMYAACQQAAGDLADAWQRTFDRPVTIVAQPPSVGSSAELAAACQGSGLVVVCGVGAQALAGIVTTSSGCLPEWVLQPDETGRSKLATLAQELGMLVLPETVVAESFAAQHIDDLPAALARAAQAAGTTRLSLQLASQDGPSGALELIWPTEPAAVWFATPPAVAASTAPAVEPQSKPKSATPGQPATAAAAPPAGPRGLPQYTRSLLHVRVPVSVTLAASKQPIGQIVELGPGSLIQFDKACDELLDLEIGGKSIGVGEVVKVGDKFGIRLTELRVPGERFVSVRGTKG